MRKILVCILPLVILASIATQASAATRAETAWNTPAGQEYAASVMGVSTSRAAEDLAVQHEARKTISELIENGDQVWFDNQTATIHVYGSATAASTPSGAASHIVQDTAPHSFPASTTGNTAASCGTSRETEEYCSPLEGGVRIFHQSGSLGTGCTAGFMVRDYSNNPYMITAGHCAIWGTTFYENPFYSAVWPGGTRCEPGPWVHGVAPWGGHDDAITPVTGCGGIIPYYHDWEFGTDTHMQGAINTQYVGEYVCHFGVTSLYACGTLFAVNVTVKIFYDESNQEWAIRETDQACGYAYHGDSGGPVTDGTYPGDATGILIGFGTNTTRCPQNNGATFTEQRIFAVLGDFGVYIASS